MQSNPERKGKAVHDWFLLASPKTGTYTAVNQMSIMWKCVTMPERQFIAKVTEL
jgi:hypothetical protein